MATTALADPIQLAENLLPGPAERRPFNDEYAIVAEILGTESSGGVRETDTLAQLRQQVRRHLEARLRAPGAESIVAAEVIAVATNARFRECADHQHPSDWASMEAGARYVELLRSGTAHAPAPRTVIAQVTGPEMDIWGYAAADALDAAASRFGLPDSSYISEDGQHTGRYKLTW